MEEIVSEKIKEHRKYCKKWRADNKEIVKEYNKKWRAEHTGYQREYDANNPERRRKMHKKYRIFHPRNPDKDRERSRKRHSRYLGVEGGHFTEKEWRNLLDKTGHRCLCCGVTDRPLQRDHVVPLGPPHSDEISNIQPLCPFCNNSKGIKTTDYRSNP